MTRRWRRRAGLRAFAAGARTLGRLPSGVALPLAVRLFVATRRFATPTREVEALSGARPVALPERGLVGWRWGAGQRTVLLVHGWNGRASQLAALAPALATTGCRVLAFDLSGHGGSSGRTATAVSLAEDLLAIGRAFGPFDGLVAHSFGAAVSSLAMVAGLEVGRAVYIAPPLEARPWLEQFSHLVGFDPRRRQLLAQRLERRIGLGFDELSGVRLGGALDVPLLVVHDRDDRDVPWHDGAALVDAWHDARLVLTEGLGHSRILSDPGVIDDVRRFMTEASPEAHHPRVHNPEEQRT
jgi:pimeloyl-ACP methyl ester carboxylesterase